MKRIWIICGFSLMFYSLPAQQLKDIQFGVDIYPQINSQVFDVAEKGKTSHLLGASVGGHVYWNAEGKLGVKAGLRLSRIQIDQIDYTILFACDILSSFGPAFLNSWVRSTQTLYYFGIPLEARLQLSSGPRRWYAKAGGEMRLHLGGAEETSIYECMVNSGLNAELLTPVPTPAVGLVSIGVGYEFSTAKGSHLFLEPTIDYSILPLFEREPSIFGGEDRLNNSHLLNFGLVLGMRF